MGYHIYYDKKIIEDLIDKIDHIHEDFVEIKNEYFHKAEDMLEDINNTIDNIQSYEDDNEGWRDELNSDERQKKEKELEETLDEDEIEREYEKYIDYLDTKYPEYVSDEFYNKSEVEKDIKEALSLHSDLEDSIEKIKELEKAIEDIFL